MTHQKIELALAFMQAKPGPAASILEQQPPEEVAAFLKQVPPEHTANALGKMLPQYAARLCRELGAKYSAKHLATLEIPLITGILRHSDQDMRKDVLLMFPEKIKIACKLLLSFSESAVGAWMTTHFTSLPLDCSVEKALSRLEKSEAGMNLSLLPVVTRDGRLEGVVHLASLIRKPGGTRLSEILEKVTTPMSGRMALISAKNHPCWALGDVVPVIDRAHRLIGILRHLDLRKGLRLISSTMAPAPNADPVSGLWDVYGESLLALLQTVTDVATSHPPQRG